MPSYPERTLNLAQIESFTGLGFDGTIAGVLEICRASDKREDFVEARAWCGQRGLNKQAS